MIDSLDQINIDDGKLSDNESLDKNLLQQDYKSESEYLDVRVDTEYHHSKMLLEDMNKNLKLQKALEKFILTRTKGLQRAFFKLRFNAMSQNVADEKNSLLITITK